MNLALRWQIRSDDQHTIPQQGNFRDRPKIFEDKEFDHLFEIAQLCNFTAEQYKYYQNSQRAICDYENTIDFAKALAQAKETRADIEAINVRDKINGVLPTISLAYIAKTYFGETRQWLYQRVNGLMVNGKPAKFTPEDIDKLNFALQDIGQSFWAAFFRCNSLYTEKEYQP